MLFSQKDIIVVENVPHVIELQTVVQIKSKVLFFLTIISICWLANGNFVDLHVENGLHKNMLYRYNKKG